MKPILVDGGTSPKETGRRRSWWADEKRRMVAESLAAGASVSKVAQRYGVNANLLFTWRRRQARDAAAGGGLGPLRLLPVTVADEGMPAAPIGLPAAAGRMEIALVGGERIVVGADVDAAALARVLNVLWRR